jgi:imidazolonepropionase-like amidohydrolase
MASLFPSQSSSSIESKYPGPVLGSDFPVEPPDPFRGMYAAVTRLNPATGTSPDGDMGWYPEEALSIEQALLGFTRNAAYGWFKEDLMGAIEVGKLADFVVVDKDVLGGEGKELRDVVVRETWVGGKRVHPLDLEEVTARWQGMVWEQTQRFIDAGMRYVIGDIRE